MPATAPARLSSKSTRDACRPAISSLPPLRAAENARMPTQHSRVSNESGLPCPPSSPMGRSSRSAKPPPGCRRRRVDAPARAISRIVAGACQCVSLKRSTWCPAPSNSSLTIRPTNGRCPELTLPSVQGASTSGSRGAVPPRTVVLQLDPWANCPPGWSAKGHWQTDRTRRRPRPLASLVLAFSIRHRSPSRRPLQGRRSTTSLRSIPIMKLAS